MRTMTEMTGSFCTLHLSAQLTDLQSVVVIVVDHERQDASLHRVAEHSIHYRCSVIEETWGFE